MIKSFRHKGLRKLWETGKSEKMSPDQIKKIKQILEVIDCAQQVPKDFDFFKSWKLHPLKGNFYGYWSVTVKENWRIIFRFENQNALDLDYLDYH